jgi:hybrid cluster-associated redox disulfide protein
MKVTDSITKNMTISEVTDKYPDTVKVLLKHGLRCIGCEVATHETIEQAAAGHDIDMNSLLLELNENILHESSNLG